MKAHPVHRWLARLVLLMPIVTLCLSHGVAAAQSIIPFKRDSAVNDSEFSRLGLGMVLTIAVLCLVLYVLRRRLRQPKMSGAKMESLQILETQRLGQRATLYVVQFAGGQYLIGHSEYGLTCLVNAPLASNVDMESVDAHP
jgi:flagellar biogenesis protein FliO